jgi:hypothetical protein
MKSDNQQTELPPLIDLPVYRDTYLSQERTDELCRLLWAQCPDQIRVIANNIKHDPIVRGDTPKMMGKLCSLLRKKEAAGEVDPISLTAMVDLMHEVDRRIHIALGVPEIKAVNNPIAQTPYGPFPPLMDLPVEVVASTGKPRHGVTQEQADRLTRELYETLKASDPEVIFAAVEWMRMGLVSGEPTWKLLGAAQNIAKTGEGMRGDNVQIELMRRLLRMNATPPKQENDNQLTRD